MYFILFKYYEQGKEGKKTLKKQGKSKQLKWDLYKEKEKAKQGLYNKKIRRNRKR